MNVSKKKSFDILVLKEEEKKMKESFDAFWTKDEIKLWELLYFWMNEKYKNLINLTLSFGFGFVFAIKKLIKQKLCGIMTNFIYFKMTLQDIKKICEQQIK